MRNLISWSGKVNTVEAKRLIVDIYNLFNGVINPVNVSQKLEISDRKVHIGFMQDLVAFAHFNSIEVNINSMCGRLRSLEMMAFAGLNLKKVNDMFATTLIDLVVHELSHLDQKCSDYIALKFTEFGLMYTLNVEKFEQANAWHTRKFIEANVDMIKEKLDVDVNYKYCNKINMYYKKPEEEYKQVESMSDVVDWVFTQITGNTKQALNPLVVLKYNVKRFGVVIDKSFYDLSVPEELMFVDKRIRYTRKKYGVSQPIVFPLTETDEYVIASEVIELGEMTNVVNKFQSEEFIYNYKTEEAMAIA